MLQTFNPACLDAFVQLLAMPDPADLPRRGHVARYEGDPNRRSTRFPAIFMTWLQRRHLEVDAEQSFPPVIQTFKRRARPVNPGLRVLRPTGTD